MRKLLTIITFIAFANIANSVEIEHLKTKQFSQGLYIQQKELPTVNILLTFNAGILQEGCNPHGIAHLVAELIDKGTSKYTAKQISEKLEKYASNISFASGRNAFYINVKSLEKNIAPTLEILQDILSDANFPEEEIKIAKSSTLQAIKQEKENPAHIASTKTLKTFYGARNKKAYVSTLGTKNSVTSITQNHLKRFTENYLTRRNMRVSVVSSLDNELISGMLDEYLKTRPEGKRKVLPGVAVNKTPVSISIEKDLPQTTVMLFKRGLQRNDPEYYTSVVFNYILGGGGFSSRLMKELREKRGLTYGVRSAFDYDLTIPAIFTIALQTTNNNAKLTEKLIKREIRKLVKNGFTKKELKDAKSFLTGSFPINLRTSSKLLAYLDVIQKFEFSSDYVNEWANRIDTVSLDDINTFANDFFSEEQPLSRIFVGGVK
ncbi:MAG: insulinase family protein [Proteobacteria bacterium]|nr:insulinase family protein [Pseudomonadota bacterium]